MKGGEKEKMRKRKKTIVVLGSLIFFLALILTFFHSADKKISAEELTKGASSNPVSSYFSWKHDWQKNNAVKVTSFRNENKAINPPTMYNRAIANYFSFDLLEGDTRPVLNSSAYTFGLITPVTALEWPVFNSVDPTVYYEYSNPSYWKGIPANVDGKFTSTKSNWPNVAHWSGWPNGSVKTTAYVVYPKGATTNDWISYTFSDDVPNNVTMGTSTQVNVDDSYEKPVAPQVSWLWGLGWNIEIPQLVKGIFKDIDDPDGPTLSADEVLGYGGEMADSVVLKNKELTGYNFVSSQVVLGPTINSTGFGAGVREPSSFYYDEKTTSIKEPTTDTSWTTTVDKQQKGIIFWYKKKAPVITLDKNVDQSSVMIGDKLTYTLTMENTGDEALLKSKITDKLPEGLSKPNAIILNGKSLLEGTANAEGQYFTWNNTTHELSIFAGSILEQEKKILTYETEIVSGVSGEKKVNTATLTGENTDQKPQGQATVTIFNPWKVTFETNGGSAVSEQRVKDGELAKRPADPIYTNKVFIDWYEDQNLTKQWDFDTPVTQDIILYAKWRSKIVDPEDGIDPLTPLEPNDDTEKPINPTRQDLRIEYVSDFDFGSHQNTAEKLALKSAGDYGKTADDTNKIVPSFISIIDDRTSSNTNSWELQAKASAFKDETGEPLKGARLLLSDLNYAYTGKARPEVTKDVVDLSGDYVPITNTSGKKIGNGTWSLAFGTLDANQRSTGVTLDIAQGYGKKQAEYSTSIDWELVVEP